MAFSSTVPVDLDASQAMTVMTANIYDPDAFGRISPLAPGAFTYYKFSLEGVSMDGDIWSIRYGYSQKMKKP